MKIIKLTFLIFIFLITKLNSQVEGIEYYQTQINKAELFYINGNKSEALTLYYDLLLNNKRNFCKDVYNALLISIELNEPDKFFEFLQLILVKGLSNDYLNERKEFNKYKSDSRWQEFLNKNSEYKCPNPSLKSKIDSIAIIDQYFRTKSGSYQVYGDTIKKIDSLNMLFLFSLVDSNTFPTEDEIGVNDFYGSKGFDIVFHHYTQSTSLDENKPKITPLIINLIRDGKIPPNRACLWLEMQNGEFTAGVFDVVNFLINGKKTNNFYPKYNYLNKLLIDEYRKWVFAEPIEDYYKKIIFKVKNPNNPMIFDIRLNTFEADEAMFNSWTKNMVELK